ALALSALRSQVAAAPAAGAAAVAGSLLQEASARAMAAIAGSQIIVRCIDSSLAAREALASKRLSWMTGAALLSGGAFHAGGAPPRLPHRPRPIKDTKIRLSEAQTASIPRAPPIRIAAASMAARKPTTSRPVRVSGLRRFQGESFGLAFGFDHSPIAMTSDP